jgi:predicted membrane channel-forming protein YqfA (hemolysin III family)
MNSKKAMEIEYLIWLMIGIVILVAGVILYVVASKKGIGIVEYIKNIIRFG